MIEKIKIDWSRKSHDYSNEEIEAISNFLRTASTFTQGEQLKIFENSIKDYLGVQNVFAVSNGTAAIEIAAALMGIKQGDEIIVPAHTWCSTAIPFIRYGAKIVWADIDPDTRLITLESIQKVKTNKTKAIVVVHLYGLMADMEIISAYARNNGIECLEDCAQALGASIFDKKAGTYGDYSIYSFHTQKNITTLGEGGALVVKDLYQAARVPGLIHNGVAAYGEQVDYWIPAMNNIVADPEGVIPFNFCLTEVQALVGSMLINRVDALNYDRIIRAKKFINALEGCYELSFQSIPNNYKHVFHLLSARYDAPKEGVNRNDLIRLLAHKYGIKCIVQYQPLYRYDLFKRHGFGDANCPECDNFFDNMISFPFYHWMPNSDFEYLIESIKSAILFLRN